MSNLDAVLLAAGTGNNMVELTRTKPKCLLPVGNHSLIWFAITGLKTAGINRIICLIPDVHENEIKQYCHKKFNSQKDLILEYVPVQSKNDCGTAESILAIKDKIHNDFIVYSCDTIIQPKAILSLINHYRLYNSTLTMLFFDNIDYFNSRQVPGRNSKEKVFKDIVAVESLDDVDREPEDGFSENKVVFMYSERDLKSKLRVRNRELALHPSIQVYSCYLDTHVYIFKRYAIEFMEEHADKVLLKGEIIPLLIYKQFSKGNLRDGSDNLEDGDDVDNLGFKYRNTDYETELQEKLEAFHPRNVVHSPYYQRMIAPLQIVCHALVKRDTFAYRVNTVGSFLDSNRDAKNILKLYEAKQDNFVKDCPVGEGTTIGDKCVLKKSCLGNNCKIGDKVKLIDCVIMDNVEIESNCSLNECIVGSGSRIGSKCDLKLCTVGNKQTIASGRKSKSEVIMDDLYFVSE